MQKSYVSDVCYKPTTREALLESNIEVLDQTRRVRQLLPAA